MTTAVNSSPVPTDAMTPDIKVIIISDDESEEMDTDMKEQPDMEEEFAPPELQADMARFPTKARKEVVAARKLWTTNTVQFCRPGGTGRETDLFVSRDLICTASSRVRAILLSPRTWPIFDWETLLPQSHKPRATELWACMPYFVEFLHTSMRKLRDDNDEPWVVLNMEWCLGAIFQCPEYQNFIMKEKMTMDCSNEDVFAHNEPEILADCIRDDAEGLQHLGLVNRGGGKFEKNKLANYILDKLAWDAGTGGTIWLDFIHQGTCIATYVAMAVFQAGKKPFPRFPPWHIFNRHKYLMSEPADK